MSHPGLAFLLNAHAGGRRSSSKFLISHFNWIDFASEGSNSIFPFFFFPLCLLISAKLKQFLEKTEECGRFLADGTVCNGERFETDKDLICPVWIMDRFILLPVYRFWYFSHQISRGRSPESFSSALCAHKGLLVFHLQMFIVSQEENLWLSTCFEATL